MHRGTVDLKTWFVLEKKKRITMSKISSTLEEFLLEMLQVSFASRIFLQVVIFKTPLLNFVS